MGSEYRGGDKASEDVITIELTPEQQRLIRERSGGRLEITQFKLRPDIDMRKAVAAGARNAEIAGAADSAESIAPPPKGTWWC